MSYAQRPLGGEHSGGRTPAYVTAHGNRKTRAEDVADFIAVVDAVDTPVLNELEKVSSRSEYYEWLCDSFENPADIMGSAPADIVSYMEDVQIDPTAPKSRTALANYSHQMQVNYAITNWQQRTEEYGISDELAYQQFKAFINLGRYFEYIILFSQLASPAAGGYANTAEATMSQQRRMHGLFGWALTTGEDPTTALTGFAGRDLAANEYRSHYWGGPGGGVDMTDTEFYNKLLGPFTEKGGSVRDLIMFTSFKVKRVMSNWNMVFQGGGRVFQQNERTVPASEARITTHADIFESDYGPFEVQPCRIMSNSTARTGYGSSGSLALDPTRALLGMDPSYVDATVQEDYYTIRLARRGPQVREALWGHMGLRVHNPKALICGLNLAA